jgi:hypothetical protein
VARRPVDDGDDWPPWLWRWDRSRFGCRHDWLRAALDFAMAHGYRPLPIIKSMRNQRPLGAELASVLPDACRQKAMTRRHRNGWDFGV